MKRHIFRALAIALALTLLCGAALAEVKTTGNVWMRKGPGLSYDQITSVSEGKSLTYLGESSTDERGVTWYKVSNGKNTGWVSSKYSKLVGEAEKPVATATPMPTEAPVFTPVATAEPTVQPTTQPAQTESAPSTLPALNAGSLFIDSVGGGQAVSTKAPEPQEQVVEMSGYYLSDLVVAANEIGLISYRQVESEAPYQYYDDAVIVAGNQYVENIVVYGGGYEVYGVRVGMNANTAMAYFNAAGLDYVKNENGVTYEHRGTENSGYIDENGHDSCINLWIDESNIVTEIDWSTYTG